jgi:SH3 domain-containing YSC84-like protein 1
MRVIVGLAVALASVSSAFADLSASEEARLKEASTVLSEMRAAPDKGIPQDLWDKAACVAVIPSVKKAAFVFGGEYGKGVVSCREGREWSAPVFIELEKGSWGFQVGAEQIDLVLLIQNKRGMDKLLQDKVALGADASIAAGPVGRTARGETDAQMSAEILSYSRAQGLFAGIDLTGGVLRPDKNANRDAYGANADASQILNGSAKVTVSTAARAFMSSLARESVATTGKK